MKKKLFFVIIILMSTLGLKVYAKPIMPPADDVPTPYIEKLGGNAIFYLFSGKLFTLVKAFSW